MGYASGGIYLPQGAISNEMIEEFAHELSEEAGIHSLNKKETLAVKSMADDIARELFGDEVNSSRKEDAKAILHTLKRSFYDIKAENNSIDISKIINQNKVELTGNINKGYTYTSGEGLSMLYYGQTNTRGTKLNMSSVNSKEFQQALKEKIVETAEHTISVEKAKTVRQSLNRGSISKQRSSTIVRSSASRSNNNSELSR